MIRSVCLLALSVCVFPLVAGDITQIKHVVIIVKQNRSFDHYFGTFPGANGVTTATLSNGQVITLPHASDRMQTTLCNDLSCDSASIDGGKMDLFDIIQGGNISGEYQGLTQMQQSDIPNYWSYAEHFVLADNMFASQLGAGFTNQLIFVAADAGSVVDNPTNPLNLTRVTWGCDADPSETVKVADSRGVISTMFPCFSFQTLADLLDNAGLTWKIYTPLGQQVGEEWNPFDAFSQVRNTGLWKTNVVEFTEFPTDAASGLLPDVSWVIPSSLITWQSTSDHPTGSVCVGENWSVDQINAVMQGPLWNSTAIFMSWDENGAMYDHVPPPARPFPYSLSLRVPLLIISPFAKSGYVSHTQYEMSSVLKFTEEVFNLPTLTDRDATANDVADSFDFNQTPLPPLVLNDRSCPVVGLNNATFGSVPVGTVSAPIVVPIDNHGATPIKIYSVSATGPFTIHSTCPLNLAAYGDCTVTTTFLPLASGPASGTLTVATSVSKTSYTIPLSGVGSFLTTTAPKTSLGTVGVGSLKGNPVKVNLTNTGSMPIGVTSIQTAGQIAETNTCGSQILPGGSCTVSVSLQPSLDSMTGRLWSAIFVNTTDPGSPSRVVFTGAAATLTGSTDSLSFGDQKVGTASPAKNVTLTSFGSTAVNFGTVTSTGDFAATTTCGATITPPQKCTVSVTFTPTATGTRSGEVTVTHNDLTSPMTIQVTGIGM